MFFEDVYNVFFKIGDGFKDLIFIIFIDKFGVFEVGIDGGGVIKEFFISVIVEVFGVGDVDLQMFIINSVGFVYFNFIVVDVLCE